MKGSQWSPSRYHCQRRLRLLVVVVTFSLCCSLIQGFVPIQTVSYTSLRPLTPSSCSFITCFALQITIRIVGKAPTSRDWMAIACQQYTERCQSTLAIDTVWYKTNDALLNSISSSSSGNNNNHKTPLRILLDPTFGKEYTSEEFASHVYEWLEEGQSRLEFVIGGAEGLPFDLLAPYYEQQQQQQQQQSMYNTQDFYETKKNNRKTKQQRGNNNQKTKHVGPLPPCVSLSKLTLTHQFARLLLIEQLYRASEIRKGSGYHK